MIEFPRNSDIDEFLDDLDINPNDIKYDRPLASMSNTNHLFSTGSAYKALVVRVDNASNSRIIDRNVEKFNSKVIESLKIGPRTCFSDGYKISEYITMPVTYDKNDEKHLMSACKSLAKMHHSNKKFVNLFNPIKMGIDYLMGLSKWTTVATSINDDLLKLMEEFRKIKPSSGHDLVPCQIDLVPENLIYSQYDGKVYIIDQEYSGMFFYEWDISCLATETAMSDEEEKELIETYELTSGYRVSIPLYYLCKATVNLLWSAWALYYDENEGNMTDYFNLRYGNYVVARDKYWEVLRNE